MGVIQITHIRSTIIHSYFLIWIVGSFNIHHIRDKLLYHHTNLFLHRREQTGSEASFSFFFFCFLFGKVRREHLLLKEHGVNMWPSKNAWSVKEKPFLNIYFLRGKRVLTESSNKLPNTDPQIFEFYLYFKRWVNQNSLTPYVALTILGNCSQLSVFTGNLILLFSDFLFSFIAQKYLRLIFFLNEWNKNK